MMKFFFEFTWNNYISIKSNGNFNNNLSMQTKLMIDWAMLKIPHNDLLIFGASYDKTIITRHGYRRNATFVFD